jgi:RimJ/RimL family protein N-acetyltransferase
MATYATLGGPPPVLETARLTLRPFGEADIAAIVEICGDIEITSRLARVPHPYSEADARYFLDNVVTRELVWAMVLRPSPLVVGNVGLAPVGDPDAAELGYYVRRSHWGRGLVTEAAAAVVRYGFDQLALGHIVSGHFADNPASGRVLSKLGFVEVGRGEIFSLSLGRAAPSVAVRLDAPSRETARP